MSTFKPRAVAGESLVVGAIFALLGLVARTAGGLHPGWIAIAVLAARYGTVGFLSGAGAATILTALVELAVGGHLGTGLAHLASGANLAGCAACVLLAWVGACHCRRERDLIERAAALSDGLTAERATNDALLESVEVLRERAERTAGSLSFLRDVASRLDGMNALSAADAAAELALARSGASVAIVEVGQGTARRRLASRSAAELLRSTPEGERLSVRIRLGHSDFLTLSIDGVPATARTPATLRDLQIVAAWCAPAVATLSREELPTKPLVEAGE